VPSTAPGGPRDHTGRDGATIDPMELSSPGRPMEPSPGHLHREGTALARVRQARRCHAHRKDGQPCGNYAINGGPGVPHTRGRRETGPQEGRRAAAHGQGVPADGHLLEQPFREGARGDARAGVPRPVVPAEALADLASKHLVRLAGGG